MDVMLKRLHHIVLICPNIDAGIKPYQLLFGRDPDQTSKDKKTGRITDLLEGKSGKLTSLAFETDDIASTYRRLARRELEPSDIVDQRRDDLVSGQTQTWKRTRLSDEKCGGIKTFIIEPSNPERSHKVCSADTISALDHLVINTPNPMRAVAHYGGRLGLDLRLDRTIEGFKTRFLFFKIGGLVFEIIHPLEGDLPPDSPDKFYGLTWAVKDLDGAHARLSEAGLSISEIRPGRKAGSRVFTVRDGTLDVPTLIIAHE